MWKSLKRLFCKHSSGVTFVRNIYGDEINTAGGKRSVWRCDRCGGLLLKDQLHQDAQPSPAITAAAASAGGSYRSAAPAPAVDDTLSHPLHPLNPFSPLSPFASLHSSPASSPCPAPAESRSDWSGSDYGSPSGSWDSNSSCSSSSDSGSGSSSD